MRLTSYLLGVLAFLYFDTTAVPVGTNDRSSPVRQLISQSTSNSEYGPLDVPPVTEASEDSDLTFSLRESLPFPGWYPDFVSDSSGWKVIRTVRLPQSFFGFSPEGIATLPHVFDDQKGHPSFVFSGETILRRTTGKPPFTTELVNSHPIPQSMIENGYYHLGDIDVLFHEGKEYILASVEDKDHKRPKMCVYNLTSLEFLWLCPTLPSNAFDWAWHPACAFTELMQPWPSFRRAEGILTLRLHRSHPLNQSHASFMAVNSATLIAYSSEYFNVTEIKRYHFETGAEAAPLPLKKNGMAISLRYVQGCTFLLESDELYITTNQEENSQGDIFVFDASTGELKYAFDVSLSLGLAEMEGITLVDPRAKLRTGTLRHGQPRTSAGRRLRMYVVANVVSLWATVTVLEFTLPSSNIPRRAHANSSS